MIKRIVDHAWREKTQIAMFLFVGGASFLMYIGTYALFSRILFPSVSLNVLNVAAVLVSVLFNFVAHRSWTYRAAGQGNDMKGQMVRYALVVGSSTLLNSFLFWLAHNTLGVYDLIAAVFAAGVCAVYTYVAHRLFTFKKPGTPIVV